MFGMRSVEGSPAFKEGDSSTPLGPQNDVAWTSRPERDSVILSEIPSS